jgi:hypothetical protein
MFLKNFREMSVEEFVAEDPRPEDLETLYGIGPESVKMRAVFAGQPGRGQASDRKMTVEVLFGSRLKTQGLVYAKISGKKNVVTVQDTVLKDVSRGWVRFINRDLERVGDELLQWFEFTYMGKAVRFERRGGEDERWVAVMPEGALPAEKSRVNAALFTGTLGSAEQYVTEITDPLAIPEEFGLSVPAATLKLGRFENNRPGARTIVKELQFGSVRGNSIHARYAKGDFAQGDLVFLVGRSSFDVLLEIWQDAFK